MKWVQPVPRLHAVAQVSTVVDETEPMQPLDALHPLPVHASSALSRQCDRAAEGEEVGGLLAGTGAAVGGVLAGIGTIVGEAVGASWLQGQNRVAVLREESQRPFGP